MLRTSRDLEILDTLAMRVRLLSLAQIAATWWPTSSSSIDLARRRLDQLRRSGLVEQHTVHAKPLLDLTAPVAVWAPGQPEPDCDAISYQLQARWQEAPRLTTVFIASAKAARHFGGVGGRLTHRTQATHDLHVAALYLRLLASDPESASLWLNEDLRPKAGYRLKDPDVILEYPDGRPLRVIEFGGQYDAQRVREFYRHCAKQAWGWELW